MSNASTNLHSVEDLHKFYEEKFKQTNKIFQDCKRISDEKCERLLEVINELRNERASIKEELGRFEQREEEYELRILELKKDLARVTIANCDLQQRDHEMSRQNIIFERKYQAMKAKYEALESKVNGKHTTTTNELPYFSPTSSSASATTSEKMRRSATPTLLLNDKADSMTSSSIHSSPANTTTDSTVIECLAMYAQVSGIRVISGHVPQPNETYDPYYVVCFMCECHGRAGVLRFTFGSIPSTENDVEYRPVSYLPQEEHEQVYAGDCLLPKEPQDLTTLPEFLQRKYTCQEGYQVSLFFARMIQSLK